MRLVVVNYCHPATPHVCALRMTRFAETLAAMGHQVVLISRDLDGQAVAAAPERLAEALAGHDWSAPFPLAVAPVASALCRRVQEGDLPPVLRKAAIVGLYLWQGGLFADWAKACRAYARPLARHFRPDLAWGTFGNTDTWLVAQAVARAAGAPWVMDIKDHWTVFIPAPLRRLLARRFRDAAAITCLSEAYAVEAADWFPPAATVIYSGIPDGFARPAVAPPPAGFTLTLNGGVYSPRLLERLMTTLAAWGARRATRPRLIYAGTDHRAVAAAAAAGLDRGWDLTVHGFVPLEQLRRLTEDATANLYVKSDRTFHHKILELVSTGRPALSFPAETAEALGLAAAAGGTLLSCADEDDLTRALDRLAAGEVFAAATPERLAGFTWPARAEGLVRVFETVTAGARS